MRSVAPGTMSDKLALINRMGPCPPNGYRFVFPEDGWVCHAWSFPDWVDLARHHLTANGKEIPLDLEATMEDQYCRTLPPGFCNYDDNNRARPTMLLDWGDVKEAITTFGTWIKNGCQFVSQDEADRRAEICSKCYLRVHVGGCAMCQKIVNETIGERKTKFDANLGVQACGVCKCTLRAMVHFRLEDLAKTESQKEFYLQVPHCWLNPNSENHRG